MLILLYNMDRLSNLMILSIRLTKREENMKKSAEIISSSEQVDNG